MVKKQRNVKSCDPQNYLVIIGFCYIRPLYNKVPLYQGNFHGLKVLHITRFHCIKIMKVLKVIVCNGRRVSEYLREGDETIIIPNRLKRCGLYEKEGFNDVR